MNTLQKSYYFLTAREKRSAFLLLLISIIKGLAETVGVASIFPFLSVLSEPERVQTDPTLNWVYTTLGYTSTDAFLFALGLFVIATLVIGAFIRIFATYAINRWVEMREYSLTRRLLEMYLRQPYSYHLTRNSSDIANVILSLARNVMFGAYRPFLNIVNSVITFILIVSLLIWANPVLTLVAFSFVAGAYVLVYFGLRSLILRLGEITVKASAERFKTIAETFSAIKQIKLAGRERTYIDRFAAASLAQSRAKALSATLNQIPKFGLEVVAFGGIIVMTLVLVANAGGTGSNAVGAAFPLIGLYALAGYRILPVVQMIYASFSQLLSAKPSIDAVFDDFFGHETLPPLPQNVAEPQPWESDIALDKVTFRYPAATKAGLTNIDIKIDRGMTVGIVGTTGAGKTTFIDVLLGLLTPDEGQVLIDGKPLTLDTVRGWQASIGYVPQDIELSDATVSSNIAMGVPQAEIQQDRVEAAGRLAKIHDFIVAEMPEGYQTKIGERGVRLSGGQRQRFGIARALYHDPSVIVFDEATSALDNATEKEVMSAIEGLSKDKTILMIAHRLSTIENCDKIIVLDAGQIVGFGSYETLLAENAIFQSLAAGAAAPRD